MALDDPQAPMGPFDPWSWVPASWQQPDPLALAEYGQTTPVGPGMPAPVPQPQPPPPPPPPPPKQVGPVGLPSMQDEVAQSELALPAMPAEPLAPVGSGLDQYGLDKQTAQVPSDAPQDMPALPDLVDPNAWQTAPLPAPTPQPRTGDADQVPLTEDELLRLYHRDPVAFAAFNEQKNAERDNAMRAREAEMAQQQMTRAEQDWADYQKSKAESDAMLRQLDADALALAQEKPKKYQPGVLDLAAAVLGMIGAPATGGQNVGLAMVNNRIEQDWAMQREEYARKKDAIGVRQNTYARLRAAGYDDFQATTAYRMASYARAKEQLLTEMQNYDPQGTTARRIAGAAIQMEQQIVAARVAAAKADIDRRTAEAELRKKQADATLAERKVSGYGAGGTSLEKQKLTPEQLAQMFPGQEVPNDGIPRTTREYTQWLETRGKGEELASKKRGNVQFESEQERQLGVRGPDGSFLADDSGKAVKMKDTDEAKKLTQSIADTDEYIRMMDEVLRLRAKYGWSSDLFASPEWRTAKTTWATLSLQKKNIDGLGALTGSDIDILHESMGASDPTSLRDPTPGIETARRHAVKKIEKNLTVRGVGKESLPQYPETWKNQAPAPNAVDEAIEEVTKADQLVDDRPGAVPLGPTGAPAGVTKEAHEAFKQQTAKVRDRVQFLEDTARGGGDNGKKARQGLVELASGKAGSPLMRDAAAQALRNLDASTSATKEETK